MTPKLAVVVLALCAFPMAALAVGGNASAFHIPTTGAQLHLLALGCTGFASLPPSTDFFVRHGWVFTDWSDPTLTTNEIRRGALADTTRFDLSVDGAPLSPVNDFEYHPDTDRYFKAFVFNFPGGMTGVHLFTGRWYLDGSFDGGSFRVAVLQLECDLTIAFGVGNVTAGS